MITRVSASLRNFAFLSIAASGLAFAQSNALTGNYVFSELGSETTTLASLTFGADGTVSGTAVVQQGFQVATYALQGTYVTNADNSKSLSLSGPSLDTVDANGNPLMFSEMLMAVPVSSSSFATLRTDQGQNVGELTAAAGQSLAAGSYQVSGRSIDPADTSVELINLDAGGNVSGQKITNAFGQIVPRSLSGFTVPSQGFQKLSVNAAFTDPDGNVQNTTETYLALASQNGIKMLQTAGGAPGLLTLSK